MRMVHMKLMIYVVKEKKCNLIYTLLIFIKNVLKNIKYNVKHMKKKIMNKCIYLLFNK